MVDFVKPKLLGSRKEFSNRFVNPITNGQCADSTDADVRIMKRRAHVLHEKLAGCVQVCGGVCVGVDGCVCGCGWVCVRGCACVCGGVCMSEGVFGVVCVSVCEGVCGCVCV